MGSGWRGHGTGWDRAICFFVFFSLYAEQRGGSYKGGDCFSLLSVPLHRLPWYPFSADWSQGFVYFFSPLLYPVYSIDAFWGTSKYFQVSLVSCDVTIQYMEWNDVLFMSYYLAQAYAGPFLLSRETSNSSSYSYRMRKVSCSRHRKAGGLVGSSSPYSQVLR
jgi:hypothetical protein